MREPRADTGDGEWRNISTLPTADLVDISNGMWETVTDPEYGMEDEEICRAIAVGIVRERAGVR